MFLEVLSVCFSILVTRVLHASDPKNSAKRRRQQTGNPREFEKGAQPTAESTEILESFSRPESN